MEIQGVNTTRTDIFPFSALRVLGSLQVFLGAVCVLLGILDLTMLIFHYDDLVAKFAVTDAQKREFKKLESMTIASAPIWCGTWFMVTGSLGTCVTKARSHSLKFLKIAFLVLSVLCSAFFGPACTVLSCMVAIMRHTMDYSNLVWLVSTTSAFLALCETGIAIVSASVACCCSPLNMAKVHILFADSEPDHPAKNHHPHHYNPQPSSPSPPPPQLQPQKPPPKRREPEPEREERRAIFPPPDTRHPQLKPRQVLMKEANVQTDPLSPPPLTRRVSLIPLPPPSLPLAKLPSPRQPPRDADPRLPVLQRPSQQRKVEFIDDSRRGSMISQGSYGYDQLRKWALPQDSFKEK